MTRIFRTAIAAAAVAMSAGSLASAQTNPMVGGAAMYPTKNIIENAVNSKDHTTLVAAVKAADLVETLSGPGPFTVFAPTNAAFAKLPKGTVEGLLKPENKDKLVDILTYHVVPGKVMAKTAVTLDMATAVNKKDIKLAVTDETLTLNSRAKVITADIDCSNGVIHVIDSVILPPTK